MTQTAKSSAMAALAAIAMTAGLSGMATAQAVTECDWRTRAVNLVEPWERFSRSFSNGAVRVALIDTVEPAAAAFHLMIISPPYSEQGDPQCVVISRNASGGGFSGAYFEELVSDYDPSVGLTFSLPVQVMNQDATKFFRAQLDLTLNQATGDISGRLQ
ncbi:hypothetical protein [Oceanomicrobium pacificus]|uniref:Uncharacterized protein n=1 Tax=Oceanomicrobium pacificus TaxID=2692916 RepID=A0A6B0THU3_9RHOB|nr:hypothetical protein [Oceanomicrobium pacificus]MXU63960.1 hypothetical protein [Oceanomicrobium pacificus]